MDTAQEINRRIELKKKELLDEFGYEVKHDEKGNIVLNDRFFGIAFDSPQEIEACLVGIYEGLHAIKPLECTNWNIPLEEKKKLGLICGFDIAECHGCRYKKEAKSK